jgi:hypothetical protein
VASHNLTLLTAARLAWAVCSCGWQSVRYRDKTAATLAFGEHLNETREPECQ